MVHETTPISVSAIEENKVLLQALLLARAEIAAKAAALQREIEDHRCTAAARDRLAEREGIFSAAVQSSNDAIITKSLDGVITGWNPAAEQLFGYAAPEAIGKSIDLIVPPSRLSEVHDILKRIARGERIEHHETLRVRKDGRTVEVSLSISPIRTPSGKIVGASKTARDIGESRKAREDLRESEQMGRAIIDTALDAFIQIDENNIIVDWNPQAEAIFGWSRQEALGSQFTSLIIPEVDRAEYGNALERFHSCDKCQTHGRRQELLACRRDGKEIRTELSVTTLTRRSGILFNAFFRDLTDRITAQERTKQAEKMEVIGQLTGGVAHDFNNILTVITGTVELLAEAVQNNPRLIAITDLIDKAATRGAHLTQHLLAFARKQPLRPRQTEINALIVEIAKLLRPTLGNHIEIESTFENDFCLATIDPNQLSTAIINLALNSRDAMPDGGKLILRTGLVFLSEAYSDLHNEVLPGQYTLIAVTDTGSGIPAAWLKKVFDPFFTSKKAGKGTGLGLSMVYGFVKQSGGHIKVSSEEGLGTTIEIYLPLDTSSESSPAPDPVTDGIIEGGHERVLVVEDDELVRQNVTAQLQSLGYVILTCRNAVEALSIVEAGTEFDLLLTDVMLPGGMNGCQLVEEIRKGRNLRVLLTSGYFENPITYSDRLDNRTLLLTKPYRKSDIAKMIRMALAD